MRIKNMQYNPYLWLNRQNFCILKEIGGEEHNGNLIFCVTGNGNTAVSCMRNDKYAISPLLMAESLKFSRLNGNRGQGA